MNRDEDDSNQHHRRRRDDDDAAATANNNNKKQKVSEADTTAKKSKWIVDGLICPITHELPFNPVRASDGQLYEQATIFQYMQEQEEKGEELISPVTREKMNSKILTPDLITKNHIETLINTDVIVGEPADVWKKTKNFVDVMMKAAEKDGSQEAMCLVGSFFLAGNDGFQLDRKKAFEWLERSHDEGLAMASYFLSVMYSEGDDVVETNEDLSRMYLHMGADRGSISAACTLGLSLAGEGRYRGGDDQKKAAIKWLQKGLSGCDDTITVGDFSQDRQAFFAARVHEFDIRIAKSYKAKVQRKLRKLQA